MPGSWNFPPQTEHLVVVHEEFDALGVIDEGADELFAYPLSALPEEWFAHLKRERSCLVITGVDLKLAWAGLEGVRQACERGQAAGAMLLINDGSVGEL